MKIYKEFLIALCKHILQEYIDKTHIPLNSNCVLCQAYRDGEWLGGDCGICPMRIFTTLDGIGVGCSRRMCKPIFSKEFNKRAEETRNVIKFYTLVIERLKLMSEEEMNKPDAFKFLIEIDESVYYKRKPAKDHGKDS